MKRVTLIGWVDWCSRWCSILLVAVVIFSAVTLSSGSRAFAQDAPSAVITAPAENDSLFGLVNIIGTASNPNLQRYSLEFDLQDTDTEQWFLIAGPISQQVNSGVLGQWNTTSVPDGRYQIRLRVVLRDGTVVDAVTQNLHVRNKQPTPLPSVQPSATVVQATSLPTAGPSSTPFIQQPPTNTPRPVIPTIVATLGGPSAQGGSSLPAEFDTVGNAFCNGLYLALAIFVLIGLYSLVHSQIWLMVRRLIRRARDDVRG